MKITVLPGDGIGPEVTEAAISVLEAAADRFDFELQLTYAAIGAAAIDTTGSPLPAATIQACKDADAVLLGAIGDPRFDAKPVRPEQGLLQLRKALNVYANIRPVRIWPGLESASPLKPERLAGVDLVIYRELTGGIYFGDKTEGDEQASDGCVYHRKEIERIANYAFAAAAKRSGKLTLVDKANVLATSRLWRKTVLEMAEAWPEVTVDCLYVDNAAMKLITNPADFDVILTENMFGDILSDEASVLSGSLGLLASASLGDKGGLFEPAHGSWPEATGKGIANPMATILSMAMMLRELNQEAAAQAVEAATEQALKAGVVTPDLSDASTFSTSIVGEVIARMVGEEDYVPKFDNLAAMQNTII